MRPNRCYVLVDESYMPTASVEGVYGCRIGPLEVWKKDKRRLVIITFGDGRRTTTVGSWPLHYDVGPGRVECRFDEERGRVWW